MMLTWRLRRLRAGIAATTVAVAAYGVLAPAATAAADTPAPPVGSSTVDVAQLLGGHSSLPANLRGALSAAASVVTPGGDSDSHGGVDLPADAPPFTQFVIPSVATRCIGGELNALAPAIAVPGPAALPLPGVKPGHATFIVTLLGTGPASTTALSPVPTVHWVNLRSGRTGATPLTFTGLNPNGPTTITGDADTGPGPVAAALAPGDVATAIDAGHTATCHLSPTAAYLVVPDAPAQPAKVTP